LDVAQLNQMVTWLDEEHRKDRAEIAKLQQQLEAQAAEIQEQTRRIQELEGRLASVQAQLTRFGQLEQAIEQIRNEVALMLDRIKEDMMRSERESERARLSDREATTRAISELRKELTRLGRIEEELSVRKTEDQRLTEATLDLRQQVATLAKDIDERTRSIPYLLEQRNQDAKRITQLQQETIELFKRIDAVTNRLPVLEANIQRAIKGVETISPIPTEIKRAQESFIEQMKLAQIEQERQLRDFQDEMIGYRDEIEEQRKQLKEMSEAIEQSKRAAQAIEQFQQTIRREQNQVAELQRLAEERQRKEWEVFQAEYEKRWQRELLNWQQRWQQQEQFNQELLKRFLPLEGQLKLHAAQIEHLWHVQEELGAHRLHEAQRWLDTLETALEQREQIKSNQEPK
jgi:chromosome segregation ATPase